jgi:type I restriction enzyme R subunit
MRQAGQCNPDLAANSCVMRITGDNEEGKLQLDNFIDPESTFPSSPRPRNLCPALTQTCHLIVLISA